MDEFDKDLRQERERRTPVRTGTRKNWPFIRRALENGEPLNRIYGVLKRAGEPVGKGPSSFRAAVKFWEAYDAARGTPAIAPSATQSDGHIPRPQSLRRQPLRV